jgi:hypothetical protein
MALTPALIGPLRLRQVIAGWPNFSLKDTSNRDIYAGHEQQDQGSSNHSCLLISVSAEWG